MTTRSRFVLPLLLLVWTGSVHGSEKQHKGSHKAHESGPPAEVCSRDKKYCVHMIPKPGHPDECTLRVSASGTTVADFQTMGYLLDVFSVLTMHWLRSTTVVEMPVIIYGSFHCEMVASSKCQMTSQKTSAGKKPGRLAGTIGRTSRYPKYLHCARRARTTIYVILSCSLPAGKAQTS